MSKFKILAVAVVAALAVPSAYAAKLTPAAVTTVNSNQFDDAASTASVVDATFAVESTDTFLGRTVAYNVRVTLSAGTFNAAVTSGNLTSNVGGTATLVSGTGAAGTDNFLVSFAPSGATAVGDGFKITGLVVKALNTTLNTGGSLNLSGTVTDPNTSSSLATLASKEVFKTAQGVAVTYTAQDTPNVIDVGQPSSKKYFTEKSGAIGSGTTAKLFSAGKVKVADNPDVTAWLATTATAAVTVTTAESNGFAAFIDSGTNTGKVFLASDATCATAIGTKATVSTDGKTATFAANALSTFSSNEAWICFDGNGVTEITKQEISSSVTVKPGTGFLDFTSSASTLATMAYNGPVVTIASFNPASNAYIKPYLRISNTSGISGRVTIKETCDDGTVPGTAVISSLAGGKSILVEASHIENGGGSVNSGAGACPSGSKSRLEIVGEIGSMKVQNFMRHNTSIGVINVNVNNED